MSSSQNKVPDSSLSSKKKLTFFNYMKSEFKQNCVHDSDEERYTERRNKVIAFFTIPKETEKFFAYGFFQCAFSFTFVLTLLPIRFVLACLSFIVRLFCKIFRLHRRKKRLLTPAEAVDLSKGLLLGICCFFISKISCLDPSIVYHVIKTQSTIKLYLMYNILEIGDRLMSALGQDTLDALFWTVTKTNFRKRDMVKDFVRYMGLASFTVFVHASIILVQIVTMNVAINADSKALYIILISNNFIEIKGSVFKKFDRSNLLQISCNDAKERFHLLILMFMVGLQTMKEYQWSEYRAQILLMDCAVMFATELCIDWVKHAFITRFNEIPIECYKEYTTILASDLITCKRKYADSDHSDLVARRMGFVPLPLCVIVYRIVSQCFTIDNTASYLILFLSYATILTFRFWAGIALLGVACSVVQSADDKKSECSSDTSSPPTKPDKTNKDTSNPASSKPSGSSSSQPTVDMRSDDSRFEEVEYVLEKKETLSNLSSNLNSPRADKGNTAGDASEKEGTSLTRKLSLGSNTDVVRRVKTKRVRLLSSATVREYESLPDYYEDDVVSGEESTMPLSRSDCSVDSASFDNTPSSPGVYAGSMELNSRGGLMTNSMVNLESVGLNEGPVTPVSLSETHQVFTSQNSFSEMEASSTTVSNNDSSTIEVVSNNSVSLDNSKIVDELLPCDNMEDTPIETMPHPSVNVDESTSDKLKDLNSSSQHIIGFAYKATSAPDVRYDDSNEEINSTNE